MTDVETSFDVVAKAYHHMIIGTINKLKIRKELEDFYQIGLIALWNAFEHYNPERGNFSAYAQSIIRGHLLMEFDRRYVRYRTYCIFGNEKGWDVPDRFAITPLEKEELEVYFTGLTENQRKWAFATFYENKKVGEIAVEFMVTEEAVKSWRKGAIKRLRENAIKIIEDKDY